MTLAYGSMGGAPVAPANTNVEAEDDSLCWTCSASVCLNHRRLRQQIYHNPFVGPQNQVSRHWLVVPVAVSRDKHVALDRHLWEGDHGRLGTEVQRHQQMIVR